MAPGHDRRMIFLGGDEGTWLGVTVADVTAEKAKELKLPGEYGAIVQDVHEGSPAAKAGLEKGDVILQFAGEKVRSVAELHRLVDETPAGRKVSVEISRNGHPQTLSTEIGKAPVQRWASHFEMPNVEIPEVHIPNFDYNWMLMGGPRLGISADELTPQLANYFGVKEGKGVLVQEVEEGTPAEKAGLKAGDVIVKVNDKQIASVNDLRKALRGDSNEKHPVTLTIVRERKEQALSIQLEPPHDLMGPKRIAELRDLQIPPEEMSRLKADVQKQTAEILKSSTELRAQSEELKQEVQREMRVYRKDLEQLKKNLEQLRLDHDQEQI
jgi:serine protease Do